MQINLVRNGFERSLFSRIPVLSPAVRRNGVEVDKDLLFARMTSLFFAAIAVSAASAAVALLKPVHLFVCLATPVVAAATFLALACLDTYLSRRAAINGALRDFAVSVVPSFVTTNQIAASRGASSLVIHSKLDLNKVDERGLRIADHLLHSWEDPSPAVLSRISEFIRNGMRVEKKDLFDAAKRSDPSLLELYAKEGMLKPTDLTGNEQVALWKDAVSVAVLHALQRWGLNVNARDENRLTALCHVARKIYPSPDPSETMDAKSHIRALLSLGALAGKKIGNRLNFISPTYAQHLANHSEIIALLAEARAAEAAGGPART